VPLKVTVAAMMSEHLILAGPVEGLVTALGTWFVAKNYPEIVSGGSPGRVGADGLGGSEYV
jgi:cobalt/nickel transport system permease protein